jgi:nucleoside-diphosphate-sugar epimerase
MSRPVVAVTGATGFIGSVLVQSLIEGGWAVNALTRSPRADGGFIQWIEGDLHNLSALQNLVKGVSAVVHCAGQVRGSSGNAFFVSNVEGTCNLVRVSRQQDPPPRFLLISSLAARQPELSWYAASKRMGEQVLIDHSLAMQYAIFRPAAVYGPGDKEMRPLFRAAQRGILPMVGAPGMRFGLLHVRDLVAAIACWLSTGMTVRGVYEIDDGNPGGYDCQSVAAIARDVWQRPVFCFFLPTWLVSLVANVNLFLARLLRYSPMLTPGKVKELQYPDWVCDIAPLTHALPHWRPRIRLQDALPWLL